MKNKTIKYIIFVPLLFLVLTCMVQAAPTTMTPSEIINESIEVLKEMSTSEDSGAFGALLKEAEGIAIFPSIIKIDGELAGSTERV